MSSSIRHTLRGTVRCFHDPSGQHPIHAAQREGDAKSAQQEPTTSHQNSIHPTIEPAPTGIHHQRKEELQPDQQAIEANEKTDSPGDASPLDALHQDLATGDAPEQIGMRIEQVGQHGLPQHPAEVCARTAGRVDEPDRWLGHAVDQHCSHRFRTEIDYKDTAEHLHPPHRMQGKQAQEEECQQDNRRVGQ